jgi:hypothetical protein
MATEYTPYYNLDLYTDADKPNLRDQYNAAMRKVDTQLHTSNDNITVAIEAANQAKEKAQEANDAVAAETTAREAADNALETAYKAADTVLDGKITAEATARTAADSALGVRIDAEATARASADSALSDRIDNEVTARANADTDLSGRIDALRNKEGISTAKFEVFSDDSAVPSGGGKSVWEYFKDILNTDNLNMTVNQAPVNTGWVSRGSNAGNARAYLENVANSQSLEYRNSVEFVILNFGFYDIYNSSDGDYETEGRSIVNEASTNYPNAIIIANPVSNNYCYGFNRSAQLNLYKLAYGMTRSQAPIRIVPWYVSFNINQLAINHYYDDSAENPYKLNEGGTNSIGAIIKLALFGNEIGFTRETRYNLSNVVTNYFKASGAEFCYYAITHYATLTSGYITANETVNAEVTVGVMNNSTFTVSDDTILAICIQNTSVSPIKGFLVLLANNNIVFRPNEGSTVNAGNVLRLLPTNAFNPAFKKIN